MAYIQLFFAADDQAVSEDQTNPVEFTLRADLNENNSVRLYAQADAGVQVTGTQVQPVGATSARWELAPDNAGSEGTYGAAGAALALGTVGPDAGSSVYFWARASAVDTEDPVNDQTVTLNVDGVAEAI